MSKRKIEISSNETNLIKKMNDNLTRKNPLVYAIPTIDDRPSIDINENKGYASACTTKTKYCEEGIDKINEMIQKSKELDERGEEAILTEDDYDSDKLIELYFEQKEVTRRCDEFDAKHPVIRTQFERMQNNKLIKDLNIVLNKFKKQEEFLKNIEFFYLS